MNAALTDNGGQTCQVTNYNVGLFTANTNPVVPLSCIGGYGANFNVYSGVVNYWYGSFDGSFGTSDYYSDPAMDAIYWVANVWGC